MPTSALLLVLLAAVLHAVWNTLAKRASDAFAFLWLSIGLASVLFTPLVLLTGDYVYLTDARWDLVAATCGVHGVYWFTLAQAYRYGDFSSVYPIARGLGVAGVPVLAWIFLNERVSVLGAAGIAIVVLGILVSSRVYALRGLKPGPGTFWALVTGVCIATYSTVDKAGANSMPPLLYVTLLGWGSLAVTLPLAWARRGALKKEWGQSARYIGAAAVMNLTAYGLVLFAFTQAKAGYVVATRETSIVIAAWVGAVTLREGHARARMAGAAIIVAGVVVLTIAR